MRIQVSTLLLVSSVSAARADDAPPIDGVRVFGEIGLGATLAVGGGLIGGFAGMVSVEGGCTGDSDSCDHGAAPIVGAAVGVTIAAPFGVYLVGDRDEETGSYLAAMGGAALGAGVAVASWYAVDPRFAAGLAVVLPAVGATIGFNLTRERKRGPTTVQPIATFTSEQSLFGLAGAF